MGRAGPRFEKLGKRLQLVTSRFPDLETVDGRSPSALHMPYDKIVSKARLEEIMREQLDYPHVLGRIACRLDDDIQ